MWDLTSKFHVASQVQALVQFEQSKMALKNCYNEMLEDYLLLTTQFEVIY